MNVFSADPYLANPLRDLISANRIPRVNLVGAPREVAAVEVEAEVVAADKSIPSVVPILTKVGIGIAMSVLLVNRDSTRDRAADPDLDQGLGRGAIRILVMVALKGGQTIDRRDREDSMISSIRGPDTAVTEVLNPLGPVRHQVQAEVVHSSRP